jgi:hypothetical protein
MRSQTTQLNWKVFPECNGKTVSLGSQSAAGWLADWAGPLSLVSLSLCRAGAVARFVNGQSIESDDDGSN